MSPPIRPPRRATHERSPARRRRLRGREQPCRAGGRRERTGAGPLAGCDATGSVRSEVRGLDVARCLPAGRCRAVLSHLSDRQGSPAGRGGEKGLRRLRCPRELPVLRPGDHAGGHLGRNHCGRAGHVRQDRVMSLPAGQRRALNRIGKTLADDDLHLGQLFAFFTRLADREPMPVTERVTALPWRRRRMWPDRNRHRAGRGHGHDRTQPGAARSAGVPGHRYRRLGARAVSRDRAAACLRVLANRAASDPRSLTRAVSGRVPRCGHRGCFPATCWG